MSRVVGIVLIWGGTPVLLFAMTQVVWGGLAAWMMLICGLAATIWGISIIGTTPPLTLIQRQQISRLLLAGFNLWLLAAIAYGVVCAVVPHALNRTPIEFLVALVVALLTLAVPAASIDTSRPDPPGSIADRDVHTARIDQLERRVASVEQLRNNPGAPLADVLRVTGQDLDEFVAETLQVIDELAAVLEASEPSDRLAALRRRLNS